MWKSYLDSSLLPIIISNQSETGKNWIKSPSLITVAVTILIFWTPFIPNSKLNQVELPLPCLFKLQEKIRRRHYDPRGNSNNNPNQTSFVTPLPYAQINNLLSLLHRFPFTIWNTCSCFQNLEKKSHCQKIPLSRQIHLLSTKPQEQRTRPFSFHHDDLRQLFLGQLQQRCTS